MKIKISELKPNPFKKSINKGKLNPKQVKKIKNNISKLGFFGSIPVFKDKGQFFIISGHHRIEALKQEYGKGYEVSVDIKTYDEDNIFRGMVIENLTQRSGEFRETNQNIVSVENYLNTHKEILMTLRASRKVSDKTRLFSKREDLEKACSRDLCKWIDDNSGEVISHDEITDNLNISHRLDPDLYNQVETTHTGSADKRTDGKTISKSQAIILARVEKDEQKQMAKVLLNTPEQRVREQARLVTQYKTSTPTIKQKILSGEIDLLDIQSEEYGEFTGSRLQQKQTISEWIIEVSQKVSAVKKVMDLDKLKRCNQSQKNTLYRYLYVDFSKFSLPFLNELKKSNTFVVEVEQK